MIYDEKKLEYSPNWKGPLKNRSCTDWPCLLIFIIFMAVWFAIGTYALMYGDIRILLAPDDSHGRKCGIDEEVINAPYLVFFDLRECRISEGRCNTPQVCRHECPSTNWFSDGIFWDLPSIEVIRKMIICETDIDVNTKSKSELRFLIDTNKCAGWYLNSTSVLGRCLPISIVKDAEKFINETQLKDAKKIIQALAWGSDLLDTLISTRYEILGLVAIGAIVCLIYIILLRWLAFPFVFITVLVICGSLSFLAYYFWQRYTEEDKTTWLVLTIVFGVIAGFILLMVLCLLRRIQLACRLIKEASKAVTSILASLVFPIFPWLLQLSTIIYVVAVGLYLATLKFEDHWQIRLFVVIHVVGFIWLHCFITALGEMILSATFATWYWTFSKFDVPFFTVATGAWRTLKYHLGTIAFGSLLITICRLVRILLEGVRYFAMKEGGVFYNACGRYVITCAQVIVGFFEKIVKFMNRNSYIVCAIYGKGLCSSASDAMSLIMRNALRVMVLNNMVTWLLWLGKISITLAMGAMTWWFFTSTKYETEHWWVPVVFVALGAYVVANVFFGVYEVAVDTIFLCFLEDCERNDGSSSKPYFMSHSLRKLLRK